MKRMMYADAVPHTARRRTSLLHLAPGGLPAMIEVTQFVRMYQPSHSFPHSRETRGFSGRKSGEFFNLQCEEEILLVEMKFPGYEDTMLTNGSDNNISSSKKGVLELANHFCVAAATSIIRCFQNRFQHCPGRRSSCCVALDP